MKKFVVFLLMVGACAFFYFRVRHLWEAPPLPVQRTNGGEKAPTNPPLPRMNAPELLAEGKALLEANHVDEAEKRFQQAVTDFPDTHAGKRAAFHLAEIYVARKQVSQTREMLAKCEGAITEAEKQRLGQRLSELETKATPPLEVPVKPDVIYVIQPGDNLIKIARKHNTKAEILRLANNLSRDLIRAGDQLTISYAYPKVVISKSQLKLFVYFKGRLVRQYPVGIGKDELTPTDKFVAGEKIEKPRWYTPEGVIPYGDPRNILGTRWITLKKDSRRTGLGIHGTTEPTTVPGRYSQGCVRLLNKNVEELCKLVPEGTSVEVRD